MWPLLEAACSAALSLLIAVASKMSLAPATRWYGWALGGNVMKRKLNLVGIKGMTNDALTV